jgi:integrase
VSRIRYDPHDASRSDLDLCQREITVRGKGGRSRIVRIGHEAAQALDRYIRIRSKHAQAWRPQLWLGVNNRGPMTANGIYQINRPPRPPGGVDAWPHLFRHHFSHTWLDRGGAEGDLMELNGWEFPADAAPLRRQRPQRPGPPQLRPHHGRQPVTAAATRQHPWSPLPADRYRPVVPEDM